VKNKTILELFFEKENFGKENEKAFTEKLLRHA